MNKLKKPQKTTHPTLIIWVFWSNRLDIGLGFVSGIWIWVLGTHHQLKISFSASLCLQVKSTSTLCQQQLMWYNQGMTETPPLISIHNFDTAACIMSCLSSFCFGRTTTSPSKFPKQGAALSVVPICLTQAAAPAAGVEMFVLQCSPRCLRNDSLARTDWASQPCHETCFLQGLCKIPAGICLRHWTGSFT